jgi:hypothetical protein
MMGKVYYLCNSNKNQNEWKQTSGDLWFNAGEKDGINRFDAKDELLNFSKPKNKILIIHLG